MTERRRMPAIFFGHGNPMNAMETNDYSRAWRRIGEALPRPDAIVSVSAHWYIGRTLVTGMDAPRTIHDFGGFPPALYEMEYPAPGSPELAKRICGLVENCTTDDRWGLDHGTWSVLCHLYPDAGVPVVQLSIDETEPPEVHYEIGRALRPLRDENVLVIGSGNIVHNLHTYAWGRAGVEPFDWAVRFEEKARELIVARDHPPLVEYESLGRDAQLSIPTPDHYLPLLYVLGIRDESDDVSFPVEGIDGGSVSMLAVRLGQRS